MNVSWAVLLMMTATPPSATRPSFSCSEMGRAAATAYRLSELPAEIRADLMEWTNHQITDANIPLLNTDAPGPLERTYATVRFAQAARFHNYWLVQFEVALFSGVRTVSYSSTENGPFRRSPMIYSQGPACASLRAALEGVGNPGSSGF
jgi:hypothetical protein